MRIVVNGIQKSGTHALMKAVYMNRPQVAPFACQHGHYPHPQVDPVANRHALIVRHPRNNLISFARLDPAMSEATIIEAIRKFTPGKTYQQTADEYAPYLTDGQTHVVRYEQLRTDPQVIRDLCAFVGYAYVEGTFEALPNAWTATNNLVKSRWQDHWTLAIDAVWQGNGLAWEQLLGYTSG